MYELLREIVENIGIYACFSATLQTPLNLVLKVLKVNTERSGRSLESTDTKSRPFSLILT